MSEETIPDATPLEAVMVTLGCDTKASKPVNMHICRLPGSGLLSFFTEAKSSHSIKTEWAGISGQIVQSAPETDTPHTSVWCDMMLKVGHIKRKESKKQTGYSWPMHKNTFMQIKQLFLGFSASLSARVWFTALHTDGFYWVIRSRLGWGSRLNQREHWSMLKKQKIEIKRKVMLHLWNHWNIRDGAVSGDSGG